MEGHGLSCQLCVVRLKKVSTFKKHLYSKQHQQKMKEVFQKDTFRTGGSIPFIAVLNLNPLAKPEMTQPIIGLSMLSLCFSVDTKPFFYLCHICEEKCSPSRILHHLSSGDHCSNYFNYTNPNVLSFSWMPSMEMRDVLRPHLIQEVNARGSGTLQMLDLPQNLITKLETSTYSEVMHTLNENEKFCKLFEATRPERKIIQTYQRDKNRKHPLLGMQHLIECICEGTPEKRYYLCTLCKLTLTKHMIIKHVLSFDHIFCYFKVWHPSTLLSKECYQEYTTSFASMMQNLAKQTEEIHATANTNMKEVNLSPAEFLSVNFKSYLEALKRLECIMEENKQGTPIPSINPGDKLESKVEYHPEVIKPPAAPNKIRCQDCSFVFDKIFHYRRHLTDWKHQQMLTKFCREDESANGCRQTEPHMPHLILYRCIIDGLKRNQPVIGASLIVTCVSTQGQTNNIYICFACKDCFHEETIRQHLHSEKHLIHTLLYLNPWRLPFAWENQVDVDLLKSMAWKEESERGLNKMPMKILDLPFLMMHSFEPLSYPKVMSRLQLYHTLLKNEVPHCETYSKLKENERFPLLGKQFLVMHDTLRRHDATEVEVGFLCLLCERRLSDPEFYAHEFSREHVAKFLDRFHPGSQTLNIDAETLLDLATQAARIHSISHVQKIELDIPIREPCHYHKAINILASVKRRTGGGSLEPQIRPKMKLTPKKTLGNVDKDHMKDSGQQCTMKKDQSGQKTTGNNKNIPEKILGGLDSEIAKKCSDSQSSTDEMKPAVGERCHLIKEEKEEIKVSISRSPSGEIPDGILKVEKDDEAEVGKDGNTTYNCIPTHVKSYPCKGNERKRAHSYSEKSQDDKGSDENTGIEMGCKRRRCTSEQDASPEQSQKVPSDELKGVTTTDTGGSGTSSHKTIKDEGSCVLIERHCDGGDPAHLCKCCPVKVPEKKKTLSHVTGLEHQRTCLMMSQKLSATLTEQQRKEVRHVVTLLEQDVGHEHVQVADLDDKNTTCQSKI
ncbi:hypothetical protein INR49_031846 [Caranx melampygus]|nr:hypothetical protein INR49_031846 [Caranx melampygus]